MINNIFCETLAVVCELLYQPLESISYGLRKVSCCLRRQMFRLRGEMPDHSCAENSDIYESAGKWTSRCRVCGHTLEIREYYYHKGKAEE